MTVSNSGTTGFSTGYGYVAPTPNTNCFPEGTYTVGANPNACHYLWSSFGPHSGDAMMIVNGAVSSGVPVWQESSLPVTAHTDYLVTAWIASTYPASPAQLEFSINGGQIGSAFTAATTAGEWQEFTATWNSGSNTSAVFSIVDQNTAAGGNDFALDDISLSKASPAPEPASLLMLGTGVLGLGWTLRRRRTAD